MAVKQYIGDSVYVEHDGYHIVLTTENGVRATNTIYIEPQVWDSLVKYVRDLGKTHSEEPNETKPC